LGARLGYLFIAVWGKKTIGIGYSMVLSELILAPVTPSNTARVAGLFIRLSVQFLPVTTLTQPKAPKVVWGNT